MKTDSQLQQDVMVELKWEPAVRAAGIGIEARNGVVTLAGKVGSYTEKLTAERAAQRVNGVQALAVDVDGGDVTLTGTVHSWAERDLATHSAWGTVGMRKVVDNMNIAW